MKSGLSIKELRDPDGGIHLARKKAQLGVLDEVQPDLRESFPEEGFNESLLGLPMVTFRTIWTYMVACLDARKQLSTAKPMVKGFNFYKSGHVLNVKSCLKDNKTFIKSLVLPSMKKTAAYSCFVLTRQGFVHSASCGCPAGIDGRCNHIAATLFALEVFCKTRALNEKETSETASTSKQCKWNIPRKRKGDVLPISKTKFKKHEYGKKKIERLPEISEDVRSPHQRSNSNTRLYNILAKVEKFQEETGQEIGLSHVLKQKTEKQLRESIQHDHDYCLIDPDKDCDENDGELLSPIKVHPIAMDEICLGVKELKKLWQ